MRKEMPCLRCGTQMQYLKTEDVQLGKTSFLFGDWPNLLAGSLEVEVYCCPACGKLEFYQGPGESEKYQGSGIAQKTCPKCGCEHDLDDPKCPRCKYHYYR